MIFMRLLVLSSILLINNGCAIPLRMETINKADPYEIKLQQARFEYEKQERVQDKIDKKRLNGYAKIQRLRAERLKKKELLRKPKTEEELILKSFNDSGVILTAFKKLGCSMFDISGFLNEYGKSDINGFCDYLETKYPFNTWARWALDREVFIPARRNYELLRRINAK